MDLEDINETLNALSRLTEFQQQEFKKQVASLQEAATYRDPSILIEEENNIYALIRSVVNLKKNKLISTSEMYEILGRIQERCKARAIFFSMPF